ncbi:PfkB family carbohydrate kinase [Pantoea sp. SJZ147]|uniref:PfkB family carbohydrate kinase n=1 Tax=Pantoea sp. SJZ147 TaxID=2572896 RepID=UPI0011A5F5B0|nr:PfkB family carbohydrate kinase [Pantoea sp. SJZ147]TWD44088.1 pfkB family carbohydrate kinase [Pantoea sp. SJZ147]
MFLEERRNQILQWLDEHERSTVNGLASQWRVTRKTRRRQGKVCIPGACHVDSVARMARFPKSGESPMAHSSTSGPGGKGARQAMAASRAGSRVHLVAKVGTEGVSQFAFDHLSSSDIHSFRLYQTDTEPTGSAILDVSQENGENMIAACSGASKTLTDAGIAGLTHAFTEADVLLLDDPHFYAIPAFPALSVNTTGAGDAFTARWPPPGHRAVAREGASTMPKRHQAVTRLNQR